MRAWRRSSAGVYTAIGTASKAGVTINTTLTSFTMDTGTSFGACSFATGDKLYVDIWLNVTSNSTGSGSANVINAASNSTGKGTAGNTEFDTPGYSPTTGSVSQVYGVTIGSSSATGTLNSQAIVDMQNLGISWLRYQVQWSLVDTSSTTGQNAANYNWTAWDSAVQQCNAAGIGIILSIFGAPSQFQDANNPLDPTATANFAQQIVSRYNGGSNGTVQGIEVGNEDYDSSSGTVSTYLVQTLKAVYPAVKTVSLAFIVGCAALLQRNSSHYTSWLDTLLNPATGAYAAGVLQADYLNFHYYTGIPTSGGSPVSLDPTVSEPSWNGGAGLPSITNNNDNNCAWELINAKRQQYNVTVPVYLTETGFAINTNPSRASNIVVSEATQWQYLQDVLDACRTSNVVSRVFLFTLGYYTGYAANSGNSNYVRDGMSLVQGSSGSPYYTQAYNALKSYIAQYPSWGTPTTAGLSALPSTLSFEAVAGGANPASQNVILSETNGQPTAWTSSISYDEGAGWLSFIPNSGTLTALGSTAIAVSCESLGLAAGTYTATITFTATSDGATDTVIVTLVVQPATQPSTGVSSSGDKLLFTRDGATGFSPLYVGDTGTPFAPTLVDDSGNSILSGLLASAISMKWKNKLSGVVQLCSGPWTITNAATGQCSYQLQAADVAAPGQFQVFITVQTESGPRHMDPFDLDILPVV